MEEKSDNLTCRITCPDSEAEMIGKICARRFVSVMYFAVLATLLSLLLFYGVACACEELCISAQVINVSCKHYQLYPMSHESLFLLHFLFFPSSSLSVFLSMQDTATQPHSHTHTLSLSHTHAHSLTHSLTHAHTQHSLTHNTRSSAVPCHGQDCGWPPKKACWVLERSNQETSLLRGTTRAESLLHTEHKAYRKPRWALRP